jgi:hypothetical protein
MTRGNIDAHRHGLTRFLFLTAANEFRFLITVLFRGFKASRSPLLSLKLFYLRARNLFPVVAQFSFIPARRVYLIANLRE